MAFIRRLPVKGEFLFYKTFFTKQIFSTGLGANFLVAGNRKRSAPSAPDGEQRGGRGTGSGTAAGETGTSAAQASNSTGSNSKESAWNLKDVIFIHEESVHETSIVKIVKKISKNFKLINLRWTVPTAVLCSNQHWKN